MNELKGAAFCVLLLLGGCQSTGQAVTATDQSSEPLRLAERVAMRQAQLGERDRFDVAGGLGIWTDEENISARIRWQQTPERRQLDLTGPLALGTLQLIDEHGRSILTRGDTVVGRGESADRVLQQGLGLPAPVPISELGYWIRGLPGNADSVVHDAQGKLSSLRYTDAGGMRWLARFKQYEDWNGLPVPSLITATGGPYSVRLVLKNWQLASTSAVPELPESHNRLPIPGR